MDFRFSEILLVEPDSFTPIKRVCITWNPESHTDTNIPMDDLLEQLEAFLLRDKSKDFPEDKFKKAFYAQVESSSNPAVKITKDDKDLMTYVLQTRFTFGVDVDAFATVAYYEILSQFQNTPIEIYEIKFTPTVVDPVYNFMQKGIAINYKTL